MDSLNHDCTASFHRFPSVERLVLIHPSSLPLHCRTVRFTLSRDSFARNRSLSSSSRNPTMPHSGCFLSFLIGFVIKFHRSYSAASIACWSRVRCSLISFVVAKTRRLKLRPKRLSGGGRTPSVVQRGRRWMGRHKHADAVSWSEEPRSVGAPPNISSPALNVGGKKS